MKSRNKFIALVILWSLTLALPIYSIAQGKGKGGPPPWAPAHGYRANTRHVYFPDHNFYFDVEKSLYIYLNGGNWQVGVKLPSIYAGIDLKGATKIELALNSDTPQKYNANHIAKYKVKSNNGQGKGKTFSKPKGKNK